MHFSHLLSYSGPDIIRMLVKNKKAFALKKIKHLKLYLPVVSIMSLSEVSTGFGRTGGGWLSLAPAI